MSNSEGKGTPMSEFQSECTNLKDDIGEGQKGFIGESLIATLVYDMIGDESAGIFLINADFRHFMTIIRDRRFTY